MGMFALGKTSLGAAWVYEHQGISACPGLAQRNMSLKILKSYLGHAVSQVRWLWAEGSRSLAGAWHKSFGSGQASSSGSAKRGPREPGARGRRHQGATSPSSGRAGPRQPPPTGALRARGGSRGQRATAPRREGLAEAAQAGFQVSSWSRCRARRRAGRAM